MAENRNITETIAGKITETTYESLPGEAVGVAKRIILDGISVALAGAASERAPRIAAEHIKSLGGHETSTVLGFGFKTSPVSAAYVNGISMHVLDYEPMWLPPTHATSPTLPAILALAEREEVPGREVIAAFAKACEIQGRICAASNRFDPEELKYHPPGVVGVMGAAVAGGHLLGLDADGLRNALGLAASRAGSLIGNIGWMSKSSHCGLAGWLGLDAALLARRGFTANPDIFDVPYGYIDVLFEEGFDVETFLNFGDPYRMVDPGFAIKMFPAQYPQHFAISAALEVRARIPDPAEIVSVEIISPVMKYVDRPNPSSGLEGKFSFQYTSSAALLDGEVKVDSFSDERRFRDDMKEMLSKVTLRQTPERSGVFDKMTVTVAAELRNGERVSATNNGPKDFWGRPKVTREEHLGKVRDCLGRLLSAEEGERCIQIVEGLEGAGAGEVRELIRLAGCFR